MNMPTPQDLLDFWNTLSPAGRVALIGITSLIAIGFIIVLARRGTQDPNAGIERFPGPRPSVQLPQKEHPATCPMCGQRPAGDREVLWRIDGVSYHWFSNKRVLDDLNNKRNTLLKLCDVCTARLSKHNFG
jgi:hypothetical protein